MGSSSSKFRKHLNNGDEFAALQLYNSSSDLRKALDPNCSYGDTYSHDTPLHLAARHAMKSLLRIFLNELGGNPNKKNIRNETPLHCLAVTSSGNTFSVQQRRAECLTLLLHWRGAVMADGVVEKVDLDAEDEKQNTPLHYAATSGMKRFVEILVAHGSPLFTENTLKQTPCDCAEKSGHGDIALYLESKMVFSVSHFYLFL
ncbi:hypothetical protein NP493_690g02041 [Ridgeia piscesae]|uniref:Uncharacterized protein n=1 Tax=Ridgeia piscesae TaxID=27915 RepID=A0AAD9NN24_RIDPI|nr:hypothetical protein NP493_690g02041 [Ridgeia piscesae]